MYELDKIIERGEQLRKLNRPQEAIVELQKALIVEPDNETALQEILLCFLDVKDYKSAEEYVNKLLTIIPDESQSYYYKAFIEQQKGNRQNAEEHIQHAISLDPYVSAYFGFLSGLYIDRADWQKALEYANHGLEINPENSVCLNYRTLCLTKLDKYDEIGDSIDDALKNDPYDAYTHANIGWTKLQTNDNEQAKIHFAEALRIDPNFDYARIGMIEAIKAKNPFYRLYLKYQFFLSKYSNLAQIGIIVAIFIGGQYLDEYSDKYPFLLPIYYLFVFLCYLTWVMKPVGNLFLRFNKYGQMVLNEAEKRSSEIVGIGIVIGVMSGIAFIKTDYTMWWMMTIISLTIVVPLFHIFEFSYLKEKNYLPLGIIAFAVICAALCLYKIFVENEVHSAFTFYNYAIIAYIWLLNLGIIKRTI